MRIRVAPATEASSRPPAMRTCRRRPPGALVAYGWADTRCVGWYQCPPALKLSCPGLSSSEPAISAWASTRARYSVRSVAGPAYTRMPVDERRRQLLELSTELFASHSFAELSMARIAREAGISKALLYH